MPAKCFFLYYTGKVIVISYMNTFFTIPLNLSEGQREEEQEWQGGPHDQVPKKSSKRKGNIINSLLNVNKKFALKWVLFRLYDAVRKICCIRFSM